MNIWSFKFNNGRIAGILMLLFFLSPAWGQDVQQVLPIGDGLMGAYYRGSNFDQLVLTRRDALIDFDWNFRPPARSLPREDFSVRWTGWVVAPATGRFLLQAQVDDGLRVWIDEELVFDEWRPQPVSDFSAAVTLKQGKAYRIRIEYFQDVRHTRVFLNWSPPDESNTDRRANASQPIPTRYLFTTNPERILTTPVLAPVTPAAMPPLGPAVDTNRKPEVAQMKKGEDLSLPEVYFQQGQAILLPVTQLSLEQLAIALQGAPDRRFEVQGHTDNVGEPALNRQLSQRRADAVCRYLIAQGVASNQLIPKGYGSTQPVADNANPAERPRNRRVVLRRL